jgi:hypothetical protein
VEVALHFPRWLDGAAFPVIRPTIMSSLFPSVVHDRLYPIEGEAIRSDTPKHGLQSFLNAGNPQKHSAEGAGKANRSPTIADLFPDTTVIFADIAGKF